MSRLFVAVVPPATVQAELAALGAALAGLRAVPAENIHLTLRFIGETPPEKQAAFEAALLRVRVEPFILPVGGVGVFPSRGPAKVLWAGAGRTHPRLHQLRKQVDERLLAVDPGLDLPGFQAHFTVGRLDARQAPGTVARFLAQHASFEAPPFRVGEFRLLASGPGPDGPPVYTVLRHYPLTA